MSTGPSRAHCRHCTSAAMRTPPAESQSSDHLLLYQHPIFLHDSIIDLGAYLNAQEHRHSACIVVPQGLSGLVRQHHPTARVVHSFTIGETIATRDSITTSVDGSDTLHTAYTTTIPCAPLKHTHLAYFVPVAQPVVCTAEFGPAPAPLTYGAFVRPGETRWQQKQQAQGQPSKFYFSFSTKIAGVSCGVLADTVCAMLSRAYDGIISARVAQQLNLPVAPVSDVTCTVALMAPLRESWVLSAHPYI